MRQPMTGVSIAVLRADAVLLVRRARAPMAGYWSLPGGRQEFAEKLEAAARRELLEETGLIAGALRLAEIFEPMVIGEGGLVEQHFVLGVFTCRDPGGEARAGDDASELQWVPFERLDFLQMTPGAAEIIRRLALEAPAPERR